jgi:signal transduction histidine kinase
VPVRDKRGKIVKWYGVINDIEDRKRAEQLQADLAHITRVNTMVELTASLAHDIKQPIGAALTNAEACARLLDRDQPDVSEAREAALEMARDARHAAQIIDRVRSLYRKDSSHLDIVDVNEIAGEMVTLLRGESHRYAISLRTDLAEELPRIKADRVQLQQVFMNLMLNGIEAMRDNGGQLIIKSQLSEGGQLLISVTDNGVGLLAERADQIFGASLPPNLKAQVWDSQSLVPLWNRTVGACGPPQTLDEAQLFTLPSPSERLSPHDLLR